MRRGVCLAALLFGMSACAGPVTESDEYLELDAELQTVLESQEESQQQLESLESELSAARDDLSSANADLAATEQRVSELEDEIEAEKTRIDPYPLSILEFMVDECAGGDPQAEEHCACTFEQLQEVMSIGQLFDVSIAVAELPIDPITGLPEDSSLAEVPGAEHFVEAAVDCLFAS